MKNLSETMRRLLNIISARKEVSYSSLINLFICNEDYVPPDKVELALAQLKHCKLIQQLGMVFSLTKLGTEMLAQYRTVQKRVMHYVAYSPCSPQEQIVEALSTGHNPLDPQAVEQVLRTLAAKKTIRLSNGNVSLTDSGIIEYKRMTNR